MVARSVCMDPGSRPANSNLLHLCDSPADPGGQSCHAPIRSVNGIWPQVYKDFYHTKMEHILVSAILSSISHHLRTHKINNIHIIDLYIHV